MPSMTKRRVLLLAVADAMEAAIPVCRETAAKAEDIPEIEAALDPVYDAMRALTKHWRALLAGDPVGQRSRGRLRRLTARLEAEDAGGIDWPTGTDKAKGESL